MSLLCNIRRDKALALILVPEETMPKTRASARREDQNTLKIAHFNFFKSRYHPIRTKPSPKVKALSLKINWPRCVQVFYIGSSFLYLTIPESPDEYRFYGLWQFHNSSLLIISDRKYSREKLKTHSTIECLAVWGQWHVSASWVFSWRHPISLITASVCTDWQAPALKLWWKWANILPRKCTCKLEGTVIRCSCLGLNPFQRY